jgi:hypothetical protein
VVGLIKATISNFNIFFEIEHDENFIVLEVIDLAFDGFPLLLENLSMKLKRLQ